MNRMCEKMEELIIDYALNELEESEKHTVEQHVQACSECAQLLEETRSIASGVSRCEMVEPSVSACELVKWSVRQQLHGKRRVLSHVRDVASSLVRRPAFAVGSALVAVAAIMLLLFLPGPQDVSQRGEKNVGVVKVGEAMKPLRTYLSECAGFLDMASRADAAEALSVQGREQWVHLKGQAMYLREQTSFRQYDAFLSDLESLFGMLEARRGGFTWEDVKEIRALISQKRLAERVNRFLKAWR
ncbi:MAG: zf-HC2 domain-containing protein [bacterium]|nr:zf-HC2 domain-containing protein [bacterium]